MFHEIRFVKNTPQMPVIVLASGKKVTKKQIKVKYSKQ